jgi:hypothetical protein
MNDSTTAFILFAGIGLLYAAQTNSDSAQNIRQVKEAADDADQRLSASIRG